MDKWIIEGLSQVDPGICGITGIGGNTCVMILDGGQNRELSATGFGECMEYAVILMGYSGNIMDYGCIWKDFNCIYKDFRPTKT